MEREDIITAAVLVIGDEILSGRTQDLNTNYIAKYLGELGIDLREVRVVPDVEEEIVAALNALRGRYSYVFTTGGIGPTHDDITADAVAKAFDAPIGEDERAIAMLLERIAPQDLNPARRRMARIPQGAELIENAISKAPGFMIGNVIVMAGVPIIMQAMLDAAAGRIVKGVRVQVATVDAHGIAEGRYAADLEQIAKEHECVTVGSYPSFSSAGVRNQIVLRSRDGAELEAAAQKVRALIVRLTANGTPL
ncbi:Putative+competence-damage+inducible+protein [Methylocapsa aurea]|jgi:molybdenum cofactor synthesis domain-containing protein|uniref:competence/damage-inducible protein A n=1 Tax=Methylocapsa aurea TaxID=663610 RepID=UPI003D18907F